MSLIQSTMTTDKLTFTSKTLRNIGIKEKLTSNYSLFCLETEFRISIISLGIRNHPRPHRVKRGGMNLFNCIHAIISETCKVKRNYVSLNNGNNIPIEYTNQLSTMVSILTCGLVNCRLVVNKTQSLQVELINNSIYLCALTETWIKQGGNTTSSAIFLNGYKAINIPRLNRTGRKITIIHQK